LALAPEGLEGSNVKMGKRFFTRWTKPLRGRLRQAE